MDTPKVIVLSFLLIYSFANIKTALSLSQFPPVVVMGFDGFLPRYVSQGDTPTLDRLLKNGVHTNFLQNVFPTKTFVNFFSIATGMYAETHGVLGNSAFDEDGNCLGYGYELFHGNEGILPIWTLNELSGHGRHSGVMMWAGNQYPYKNVKPTFYETYNVSVPWRERINATMGWLMHENTPANLILMYFEQPDSDSHQFGINTVQVHDQIKRVDLILEYYLKLLAIHDLVDKINLIILSDHGMVNVNTHRIVPISRIINSEYYEKCGGSPVLQIIANSGYEEQIYQNLSVAQNKLKLYKVYKADEIPKRWHFKNNKRNKGLLVVADSPFIFDDTSSKAEHGYDNEDPQMHAFFTASGPIFRKKFHVNSLNNIDIYPLIVFIMELDTSLLTVKPNGTLSNILSILDDDIIHKLQETKKEEILKYFIPLSTNFPDKQEAQLR